MSAKRLHLIFVIVIALLFIGLLAGTYGINSLLASRANKLLSLKAQSQALADRQINLAKAKKDIQKYTGLEKITQSIVPEDKSQAEAVREIVNIASSNNVSLASITFPASTLGVTANGSSAAPAQAGPAAAATPSNSKTNNLTQLLPVKTIPGLYQLTITVTSDPNQPVRYDKFISFLAALENNRRTAQVSTITLSPDPTNRNLLGFTLGLNEYIKP